MKNAIAALVAFFMTCFAAHAQVADSLFPKLLHPNKTTLKVNINGLRVALEQRLFKNVTVQLEAGHLRRHQLIVNPQLRYYQPIANNQLGFIGLSYLYKHDEYNFSDSFTVTGSNIHDYKQMSISKYIHAFTVGAGYLWYDNIFKHRVLFEFNFAAGIRYKKSNRYGLNKNEEMVWGEAYILRPQHEQDTEGRFVIYPEITLAWRVLIPLVR